MNRLCWRFFRQNGCLSIIIFQNGFLWIVVEQYNNKTMDENDATDANTPRDAITTMEAAADEVILRMI